VTSKDFKGHDMMQFQNSLEALAELSPQTRIFCLIHKMDLLAENVRTSTFEQRKQDIIDQIDGRFEVECFRTSIWDETLYKAWSQIVAFLLPNIKTLEKNLKTFCETVNADEVVLFERSTFLVISHYDSKDHED